VGRHWELERGRGVCGRLFLPCSSMLILANAQKCREGSPGGMRNMKCPNLGGGGEWISGGEVEGG